MPMNPKLLRPRSTIHPEAADWANRVRANSGSVSGTTLNAVSKFCASISSAGIRDRFYRLNLFCGTGLAACLMPLYRGPSLGGTQYGGTTDTNNGPFVSGDYTETGTSGGLKGNGTTKYLDTGFAQNVIPAGNRHLAVYETAKSTATFDVSIGSRNQDLTQVFYLTVFNSLSSYGFYGGGSLTGASTTGYTESGAHLIGNQPTSTSSALYKNGSSVATATPSAATPTTRNLFVFALNDGGLVGDNSAVRLSSYSVGLSFTASQASAYYAAMQAFQTSLGRNA